jgi:hypothetical protein
VLGPLDTQIALVEAEEGIAIIPSFGVPACRNRKVTMSQLITPWRASTFTSSVAAAQSCHRAPMSLPPFSRTALRPGRRARVCCEVGPALGRRWAFPMTDTIASSSRCPQYDHSRIVTFLRVELVDRLRSGGAMDWCCISCDSKLALSAHRVILCTLERREAARFLTAGCSSIPAAAALHESEAGLPPGDARTGSTRGGGAESSHRRPGYSYAPRARCELPT